MNAELMPREVLRIPVSIMKRRRPLLLQLLLCPSCIDVCGGELDHFCSGVICSIILILISN